MVVLEKFERKDFERLINWIDSEESMIQFSGPAFDYPITISQLENYIGHDNRLVYRVVDSISNEVIGHAEFNNINKKHRSARISRVLIGDISNRNKGYGKAVIKELVRIGFSDMQLHRIDLGVFEFNHQAIKCYKDCGFEIEGLLRDTSRVGEYYWSIYNMSIINPNF